MSRWRWVWVGDREGKGWPWHRVRVRVHPAVQSRRAKVVKEAEELLGVHEQPPHSNAGPGVHRIQTSTGAYGQPWCVSFVQYVWKHSVGSTWADKTASAYYLLDYAERHGAVIPKPVVGCTVVYKIGAGHAGIVVGLRRGGRFVAVEGNEGDAVRRMVRDPRSLSCHFVLRPELR